MVTICSLAEIEIWVSGALVLLSGLKINKPDFISQAYVYVIWHVF